MCDAKLREFKLKEEELANKKLKEKLEQLEKEMKRQAEEEQQKLLA